MFSKQAQVAVIFTLLLAGSAQASPGWGPAASVSGPSITSATPQVVVDGHGVSTAVWVDKSGADQSVMSSTRPMYGPWSAPVRISQVGSDIETLKVAVGSEGRVVAAWEREHGTASVEAAVRPAQSAWGSPTTIEAVPSTVSGTLDVVVEPDGSATIAWSDDATVKAIHTGPSGDLQYPSQTISGTGDVGYDVTLGVTSQGVVSAAFGRDPTPTRAYVALRSAAGAWAAPVAVSPPGENVSHVTSATGAGGTIAVIWTDMTTLGGPYRIRAATTQSPAQAFEPAVTISGSLQAVFDQLAVAVNSSGDVAAGWSPAAGGTSSLQVAEKAHASQWEAAKTLADGSAGEMPPELELLNDGTIIAAWNYFGSNALVQAAVKAPQAPWEAVAQISPTGLNAFVGGVAQDGRGNAVLAWDQIAGSGFTGQIQATAYDTTPPVTAANLPEGAFVGVPVTFLAQPADLWSGIASTTWAFGDGQTGNTAKVDHVYSHPGSYTVSVQVKDGVGFTATQQGSVAVAQTRVTKLSISPRSFKASKRKPAQVTYKMNKGVPVTFTIERKGTGRKSGARCVKKNSRNNRRKPCVLWTAQYGSFSSTETAADGGKAQITGYLGGRKLSPGTYRLRATPKFGSVTGVPLTAKFALRR